VGRSGSLLVQSTGRELLSVKSNTKATFYTRAEKLSIAEEQDTSVVNLGLNESGLIEIALDTDLDSDI